MKKFRWLRRFGEGLVCVGVVVWEGFSQLFTRCRNAPASARNSQAPVSPLPAHFPPGDWRREVLHDFASWLEEIDASTERQPPMNLSHDLLEVLTEVSAFRQEVKRQNREQSKLTEELVRMEGLYREALAQLNTRCENLADFRRDVQQSTERSVFLLFADLRDALQRGLDEVRRCSERKGLFTRLPSAWRGVQEGYEIALERFDRSMAQLGIQRIPTLGQPFDSRFMVAIGTRYEPGVETNIVVDESMSGYVRGDEILRTAQVVVAAELAA